MKPQVAFVFALLAACSSAATMHLDEYPASNVSIECESMWEDSLRLYFTVQNHPDTYCPGVRVRQKGEWLYVTFVRAEQGTDNIALDAATVPKSAIGHPYVEFPIDVSVFVDGGTLTTMILGHGQTQQLGRWSRDSDNLVDQSKVEPQTLARPSRAHPRP